MGDLDHLSGLGRHGLLGTLPVRWHFGHLFYSIPETCLSAREIAKALNTGRNTLLNSYIDRSGHI